MKWIDLDAVRLISHPAILVVNRIDMVNHEKIVGVLKEYQTRHVGSTASDVSVLEIEKVCRQIISDARPELADATILFINFDVGWCTWQIGVEHPSLPPYELGSELRRLPLVPEDGHEHH